jgi:hypothetical protein
MICTKGCGNYCTCPEDPNQNRIAIFIASIVVGFIILVSCCNIRVKFSDLQAKVKLNKLDQYRDDALMLLLKHRARHPDCVLNNLYDLTGSVKIEWFEGDRYSSALFYNGIIHINKNYYRSREDASITIIHEVVHAYGICGDDTVKRTIPICTLFGKPVYYSPDITILLKEHLKEELNK